VLGLAPESPSRARIISRHDGERRVVRATQSMAVIATTVGTILSMIDQTIANTALPTIARDVHASAAASIWVINAYQLALTIAIVPFAAMGDNVGYARVYRWGMIAFVVASLACVLSQSLTELVVARFFQGIAGASMAVTTGPLLRRVFPPAMLGRATGFTAMSVALGAAAGPVVSGLVLSIASWQWLFALNIPVGLTAFVLAWLFLRIEPGTGAPYDWTSAWMSVATFGLTVIGFDGLSHHAPVWVIALEIGGAAIVGTAFIRRQLALPLPMFAVDLFARAPFSLAVFACYTSFIAQTIAYIALPFLFQTVLGRTPLEVGELLLPWLLASAVVAPFAGRLADRFNSSRLAALGLAIFAVGLLVTVRLPENASGFDIVWRMLLCGVGYGLFQSPNNRSIQNSVPRERSGAPQAIQGVARLTGQTTGAVLVALVFSLADNATHAASGTNANAITVAMVIATGCAVVAAAASVWRGTLTGAIKLARA
jgi:DHA2 family multidrug resistance protein-like MFS transporter